ncbi:MAG: hypothetical protein AB1664_09620 [Thermodesulfobacteriota bacterium]
MWQEIIVIAIVIACGAFLAYRYWKKLLVARTDPTECVDVCDACGDKPLCKRDMREAGADEQAADRPSI